MKFSLFRYVRMFIILGILGASSLAQAQVLLDIRQEDPELPLLAGETNTFVIFAQGMTVGLAEVSVLVDGEVLAEAIQADISEWMAFDVVFDAVGTWDLVVRAIDEDGVTWNSNPVSFEVGYAPPEVRILAPLEGTQHPVGTILPVQLAAYDGFGLITDIELWLNDQRILNYFWNESDLEWVAESTAGANYPDPNTFEPSEKPFRASVQLLSAGRYKLEARVTSTSGLSSISEPRFLEAEDPELGPVLNMVFPVTGSQYLPGTNLPVQVEGFDPGSLIEQVEYLLNGVVIDTVVDQPFRTNVQLPSVGQYRLQARALTTFGQFAYSQEVLLSTGPQDGVTPRVVLDFPLPLGAGDTVNDVSLASEMYFNAAVVDPDGGAINDVQFYINGQLVGSAEDQVGDTYSLGYKPAAQGSYILSASATDDSGRVGWSLPLVLEVGPLERPLPEAFIVGENLSGIAGRELTLEVAADGGLIAIDRVDLLLDGVYLGSVLEADDDGLYRFNWVPDEAGEYRIEARVVQIDPADSTWDNWVITDPVSLSIAAPVGKLPSVFLESLSDAGPFVIGSTVMLVAQAYDPEGEIEEVNIYSNGARLATLADAPYLLPYTFEFAGQHALQSTVVDGDGNVIGSNIILLEASQRVLSDGSALRMDVPLSLKVGEPLQFAVSTVGSVLQASRTAVYGNGQLLVESSESPHLLDWTPGFLGEVSLFASAEFTFVDGSVLVLTSPVTVRDVVFGGDGGGSVDLPPVVELFSSNVPGGWVRLGQTLVWKLEASDNDAVVSIEVLRNGEVIPTASVLPLEVEDVIEDMGIFRYVMRVRDTSGNLTESAVQEIRATRGTAPEVAFVSATLPSVIYSEGDPDLIEATAFAADEPSGIPDGIVSSVEFYLNGELVGTDLTQPYRIELDPSTLPVGSNYLSAVAVSDTGLRSVPAVHEMELVEGAPPVEDPPPVVERFSSNVPGGWARLGQTIVWDLEASDNEAVVSIEILRNGEVIPTSSVLPTEVEDVIDSMGLFRYMMRVRDTSGNVTESAVQEIEATRGTPPVAMFMEVDLPASLYSGGDPIMVEAIAFAADEPADIPGGQVTQVEFFLNGDFLGADLTQPYLQEIDPSTFLSGTNTLSAVAVSDTGLRSVPAVHEIALIEGSLPVINSLLVNTDGLRGLPGTLVTIEADVEDKTGIARVELLLFGEVLDSLSDSPYTFEVSLETVGSYGFSARAVNVDGHAVESAVQLVEVVHPEPLLSEHDFVHQVFHDLLFRAPTETELAAYSSELLEGALTRERFVAGLLGVGESNANTAEYAATRLALLGLSFAADRWPSRLELKDAVMEVRAGGIDTVVARRMPAYEAAYRGETGLTVPDILSSMEQIASFVGWLFREKYGFAPNADQLELAIWHFRALGRDAYTADFLSDNTLIALPEGWASSVMGFQFMTPQAPYNVLLDEVEAASLLINLLRIVPSPAEVEGFAGMLTVSQIASIVADSRYAARFESTFSSIEVHREGWLRSDWFGWFNPLQEPWVFHNEQGWVAFRTSGQSESNLWYYDPSFGWMWTQSGLYPYLFDASGERWLWNWRKPFVGGQRLYLDLDSMEWISK